ncbi:DUF3710 domain-containing protein [Streptomyces xantholiticus]|uniref:DUF3710 domain-containing protein n=1 Tax=Streptomyces xantholiticus TaxID=68285 RepID=UPI001678A70A|nr:DUF3710 domain-containing protein [Streptomyces xantholiticus]GGW73062.1 hypothetical protein GCM10010381_67260 [Streptomyces xantholiticus]
MTARRQGGRPWGPIRAETAEAAELARFLRAQVDASGKTLATLAGQVHVSKSQISERLAGKVPDRQFVTALIRVTVPEPRLRVHRLQQAEKLLQAAADPSPRKRPAPMPVSALELAEVRAQQVEIYDRLTRSLEQQNQLREAAGNSAKLVMVLLTMINKLEQRISNLTDERNNLRSTHVDPAALRRTQRQLARAQEQEQRAGLELQRAQEKQRQAEDLAARVQARVDELTDELDRLRANDGTTDTSGGTARCTDEAATEPASPAVMDPVGDDIDLALARASVVNDQDDQVLQSITDDLTQGSGTASEVVPDNRADNPAPTIVTMDNLRDLWATAHVAAEGGDYREALRLYTTLHTTSTQVLGPEHPDTLSARLNLAHWRGKAGDAAGTAAALAELLPVCERVLGSEHTNTLTNRHNLARWRGEAGDAAGAAAAFTELLPVYERVLGPEHPHTLITRLSLARWRGEAGDAAGTAAALSELLPVCERVLGREHPDTLSARLSLAHWRGEAGDAAGAAAALAELLPVRERVLGPEHPHTLITRHSLADWQGRAGDAAGAAAALAELLPLCERVLGPEHPDTLTARHNAARWKMAARGQQLPRDNPLRPPTSAEVGGQIADQPVRGEFTVVQDAFGETQALAPERPKGPWDSRELLAPQRALAHLDLGGLLVPNRAGMRLTVAMTGDAIDAVNVLLSQGTIGLAAMATIQPVWDAIRTELADGIVQAGGSAAEVEGTLGWELRVHLTAGARVATRFVGADGPGWFLRGAITGEEPDIYSAVFDRFFRDTVVVRGDRGLADRAAISLTLPSDTVLENGVLNVSANSADSSVAS